jgi:hypothetical protein
MAGVSYGTGNLLYWGNFQRRRGEPKRPFRILRPVEIPCPAASIAGRDRESLEEEVLLAGWIPYVKSRLESIQKLTQLSRDRLSDKELAEFLHRRITEHIRGSGLLLDSLLSYFQVTTPIKKRETVNILIGEVLKKNQAQLKEKEVKLFKKLERDLPEIIIPEEPLKFVLKSILQYGVTSMPVHETLGLSTRSFFLQKPPPEQALFGRGGQHVEITLFFTGCKKPVEPLQEGTESKAVQKEDRLDLLLKMVNETVRRNRGVMKLHRDEKEAKLSISLEFPVERRRAFYHSNDN